MNTVSALYLFDQGTLASDSRSGPTRSVEEKGIAWPNLKDDSHI